MIFLEGDVMKKKWLKIMVIGASIGLTSSHAGAIDLSGVGSLLDFATSGLGLLCGDSPIAGPVNPLNPTEATTAKNTGSFLCDASKIFDSANKAATTYKEFQNKINGATTADLLKAGMVFALSPQARAELGAKIGAITTANGVDGVSTAVDDVRTQIEAAFKGKTTKDKDVVQEELTRLRTAVFGGKSPLNTGTGSSGVTGAQTQAINKTLQTVAGVNNSSNGFINAKTAQQQALNTNIMGTVAAANQLATTEFTNDNTKTAKDNQTQTLTASKKLLQESDQAVSTRATIQVTNKLLANIMLAQSNQSANLISALQKLATASAMTAQQLGTSAQALSLKSDQDLASAEQIQTEVTRMAETAVELNNQQLKGFIGLLDPKSTTTTGTGGTGIVQTSSTSGSGGQATSKSTSAVAVTQSKTYWGGNASSGNECNPLEDLARTDGTGKLLNCTGTIQTSELGQYRDSQGKSCDPRYDTGIICTKPLPAGTKYEWRNPQGQPCDPTLEGGLPCNQVIVPTTAKPAIPTEKPLF
jgi:hypothetical protein